MYQAISKINIDQINNIGSMVHLANDTNFNKTYTVICKSEKCIKEGDFHLIHLNITEQTAYSHSIHQIV